MAARRNGLIKQVAFERVGVSHSNSLLIDIIVRSMLIDDEDRIAQVDEMSLWSLHSSAAHVCAYNQQQQQQKLIFKMN